MRFREDMPISGVRSTLQTQARNGAVRLETLHISKSQTVLVFDNLSIYLNRDGNVLDQIGDQQGLGHRWEA